MNFLNIGTMELMVIIAIAILAIGPKRMVQVARTIGRLATRMRQISGEFTSILRSEFAELDEARQEVQGAIGEIRGGPGKASATSEVSDAVGGAKADADQSMGSLLEDGLGLGQIAAELKATATEARQFVRKASRAEAEEEHTAPSEQLEDTRSEELASVGDGLAVVGVQEEPVPGEAVPSVGVSANAVDEASTPLSAENGESSAQDTTDTAESSDVAEHGKPGDDATKAAGVDTEQPPNALDPGLNGLDAVAEKLTSESAEVGVSLPPTPEDDEQAECAGQPGASALGSNRRGGQALELEEVALGEPPAAVHGGNPDAAGVDAVIDPEAGQEDV